MLDVMNYFPAWPTFEKILALTKRIMGIDFKEISSNNSLERCHPSVRIFEVTDKTSSEHLGRFYVDVFSREGKIDWGWQTNIWRLKDETKGLDKLIWMVGNLEEDEYLHYEELEKLLETFGNAIQLFLTRSPYMQLTIPHVMYSYEWDAKDFLKSFFKFFLSKPDMLMTMSSQHLKTGQLLSPEKAKNISHALARGNFWDTWRTLFWADYDLSLFELEKFQDKYYLDLYKEVYAEYFPFPIEHNNFHPCSFIPIFVPHSMPCMYYRKLWCETLALDVHQTFDNEGDTLSTANRLKEIWLNNGALKSQWEMYTQFQGREPNVLAISNYYDPILTPLLNEDKKVAIGC